MKKLNRVMIAAPKSGSGKTIFTLGLLSLLKKKADAPGQVVAFKSGPDYIDPMFHRTVVGIPSENLDSFFDDEEGIRRILSRTTGSCGVMEGVMGIYDGINGSSGYDVATITATPIILIIDGKGIWNTITSLVKGLVLDDTNRLIRGVIINRVSQKYYDTIGPLMDKMLAEIESPARSLGFVPDSKDLELTSRHLGLKLPWEIDNLKKQVENFGELIEANCDMEAIYSIMEAAPPIAVTDATTGTTAADATPLRLAVARDEAFCFYYNENMRTLRDAGIETVDFSPLHDEKLPEGISGILLGGGYPELYSEALAKNETMRSSIRKVIENGMPSLAECGGFMYLLEAMETDGTKSEMVGAIPGSSRSTGKLSRFGYIQIQGQKEGLLAAGELIKGHEFHYFDSDNNGTDCIARKPDGRGEWSCVHQGPDHFWGYPHLYYPSNPRFLTNFKNAMEEYLSKNG